MALRNDAIRRFGTVAAMILGVGGAESRPIPVLQA